MGAGLGGAGVAGQRPGMGREERRLREVFRALAVQSESEGERGKATLDKSAFLRFFSFLPGMLGERLFAVFDKNDSGAIDFEEFFQGVVRIYAGTMEEKRKFLFDMYDLDGDGVVTSEELATLLTTAAVPASMVENAEIQTFTFNQFCSLLETSPTISALLNIFHHDTMQAVFEAVNVVCPMCNASVVLRHCSFCGVRIVPDSSAVFPSHCVSCHQPLIKQPLNFCLLCGHSLICPVSPRLSGIPASFKRGKLLPSSQSTGGCCGFARRSSERRPVQGEVSETVPFLYIYGESGEMAETIFLRGCEFERVGDDEGRSWTHGVGIRRLGGRRRSGGRMRVVYCETRDEREEWLRLMEKAGTARRLEDFYEVEWTNELGKGKYGTVYVGRRIETKEEVAVKNILRSEEVEEREFLRTEKAVGMLLLGGLEGESIVKIYDIFETSESIYVVMEYMGDGDLLNYLLKKKEKRLENEEAALAVESVLKALDFLHSRGVTHRDVKIENCLVNLTQNKDKLINCKLSDFGLAALSPQGKSMSASLGTVAYAAPEVILRQKYDRSVDLWGVGCLLYVLLSGKLPFGGTTDKEIANSVTNVKLHFKGEFWDADAVHLIKHLLVRNPKHRYTLAEAKAHQWLVKYRPVNHRL